MAHKKRRTHKRKNPSGRRAGNYPTGVIEFSRQGVAFVDTDEGSFIIGAKRTGGAMPGDTVEVRPHKSADAAASQQRRNASVVRVTHRATEYLVGVLEINDPLTVVVVQDPRVRHDLFVTEGELPAGAKAGDVVLAKITQYPARHVPMQGYVVEVLGQADAPGMDVDIIIHNAGLATEFSPQALEQAASITPAIEEALAERGRRDLRQRTVFTIDPADAKDFDDALSLERVEGLWRLGVHIADVSSYVPFDSSIDLCARDRGTSVYLVDRVLPMLPEVLSNDVCSLRPGQARRTMTCDMFLSDAGQLVRYDIYPSVITSKRRYTYTEVQAILEGGQPDEFEPQLQQLHRLAQMRVAARAARGALDFEFPEAKPILDEDGKVQRVELREKTDATSLVEEAMILANETVAQHLRALKRPCVYRVHEAPTAASLATLLPVLKELGYSIEGLGSGEPARFQQLLASASGKTDAPLVNSLVLRSMERAHYSVELSGHFGLASECYCHFTSPIRRYPDLMVHRLLKDAQAMEGQLEWLARHSSKMERVAEEAEDDSVALKLCEFMEGQVGQVLEGSISRVQQRSLRVRLANTLEGHVRIDPVHDGAWRFDATRQLLTSDETGRSLRLGQRVLVHVDGVYPNERRVELSLA